MLPVAACIAHARGANTASHPGGPSQHNAGSNGLPPTGIRRSAATPHRPCCAALWAPPGRRQRSLCQKRSEWVLHRPALTHYPLLREALSMLSTSSSLRPAATPLALKSASVQQGAPRVCRRRITSRQPPVTRLSATGEQLLPFFSATTCAGAGNECGARYLHYWRDSPPVPATNSCRRWAAVFSTPLRRPQQPSSSDSGEWNNSTEHRLPPRNSKGDGTGAR